MKSPAPHQVLLNLNALPRKILSLHGLDNLTEFVLHELSHEDCFNLKKAAYLIDNPDFDCLKGIAGFCAEENAKCQNVWQTPDAFSAHMQGSNFNQKVRAVERPSLKHYNGEAEKQIDDIAHHLQVDNHDYHIWQLKNNNRGILIFKKLDSNTAELDEHMLNALHLLSFCPVF